MTRITDLSLLLRNGMRGVQIEPAMRLETNGWNASQLTLYSHAGTHMDAPRHFLTEGETIDIRPLEPCVGPALVINLAPVAPRALITVEHLAPWQDRIQPGSRLLFRTDWSHRHGTPEYRDELPRISLGLAEWLVKRKVALIGVEPPSVADVNDMQEVTAVHRTLLSAGIVIVEGLTNLDQLHSEVVQFIALPLKIDGGDGTPVCAIAIEADDNGT